jgi:hypothetical protein
MIAPTYSMMTSPSAMSLNANTPLPWTPERRVWMRRESAEGAFLDTAEKIW